MSDNKIAPGHLERKAVLYIRQSTPYQVIHNDESRRLQYGMQSRLGQLGWREVQVVDEDLGRSASGGVTRAGFEQMVAEVCMGKVGAVAAREVSRFARNSREWQQLVEVCRVVDTLLIDHEAVYDPRRGNDRLLLGLKGSLNEYELDLLRLRSSEARREKARRGELIVSPPIGFIKTHDDRLEKNPDRRVQESVQLVFSKFFELGSVRQVLMWFLGRGLSLPVRRYDISGHETLWRRPTYGMMMNFLTNPIYAGAYAYGKTETISQFRDGIAKKAVRSRPTDRWVALIPEHHEGYIPWDQFQRVQSMISKNSQTIGLQTQGAAKRGLALLTGLLRCRRCGRMLTVQYTGRDRDALRYSCTRGFLDIGEPKCISFGGTSLDEAISRQALAVVQPGAVEAAVLAGGAQSEQDHQVLSALQLDLQAARYNVQRAWKQYDAVDPDNRLVADELEKRWNTAMEQASTLEQRVEEEQARRQHLTPPSLEVFHDLATNLQAGWEDSATDVRLKKRILRTLIHEVIVDIDRAAGKIDMVIHWQGGAHTQLSAPHRRRGQCGGYTDKSIIESVRLLNRICGDDIIASYLNRNHLLTGMKNRWTRERVVSLRSKHGISPYSPERQQTEGWLNLTDAAAIVGVSSGTLRVAAERGEIPGVHPLSDGPWIFNRTNLQGSVVDRIVQRARRRCGMAAKGSPEQLSLELPNT